MEGQSGATGTVTGFAVKSTTNGPMGTITIALDAYQADELSEMVGQYVGVKFTRAQFALLGGEQSGEADAR